MHYVRMTKNLLIAAVTLISMASSPVYAHEDEHDEQIDGAGSEARVMHLASDHELTFGAGMTMIGQNMSGASDDSVLNYSLDLAFEGDLGERGQAFIYLINAEGAELITNALSGSSNADYEAGTHANGGFSDLRVAEAWYEASLGEHGSMRVGKIDATGIYDGNEIANDQTTQFLADVFVNNAAVAFPAYTAGLSIAYEVNEGATVNMGVFESEDEFTGKAASAFSIAELDLSAELMLAMSTNLRLIAWQDDATDNEGFAVNIDQAVNDELAVFLRYGSQEDTEDYDSALSLGGQWALDHDMLGFAYSLASSTGVAGPDDESQLEIYYSHALSNHLHITADFQQVSNPGFDASQDDVTVVGLRVQADL